GPRLPQEALHGAGVIAGVRQEELQGDPLVQGRVGGRDDDTHPALPEHAVDHVLLRNGVPGPNGRRQSIHDRASYGGRRGAATTKVRGSWRGPGSSRNAGRKPRRGAAAGGSARGGSVREAGRRDG